MAEFSSPVPALCADSFSVTVPPPVLPQWHVKDPGHSVKSAGDTYTKQELTLDPTKSE